MLQTSDRFHSVAMEGEFKLRPQRPGEGAHQQLQRSQLVQRQPASPYPKGPENPGDSLLGFSYRLFNSDRRLHQRPLPVGRPFGLTNGVQRVAGYLAGLGGVDVHSPGDIPKSGQGAFVMAVGRGPGKLDRRLPEVVNDLTQGQKRRETVAVAAMNPLHVAIQRLA